VSAKIIEKRLFLSNLKNYIDKYNPDFDYSHFRVDQHATHQKLHFKLLGFRYTFFNYAIT